MTKRTSEVSPATPATASTVPNRPAGAPAAGRHRPGRQEPNPLGGNFILMPSLLEYLSPDLTLPEQYFSKQQNDDGMGAEKSLMYAVLKDGIRCFYKHVGATRRKHRRMSAEAEEWLLEDSWDYPFAFRVICDTLGIDPDCLRQRLIAWKEAELERQRVTGDTKTIQVGRSPFPSLDESTGRVDTNADSVVDLQGDDSDDDPGDEFADHFEVVSIDSLGEVA